MATHFSILPWEIPWTEGLAGYSPWGCKELGTTAGLNSNNIPKKKWSWDSTQQNFVFFLPLIEKQYYLFCNIFFVLTLSLNWKIITGNFFPGELIWCCQSDDSPRWKVPSLKHYNPSPTTSFFSSWASFKLCACDNWDFQVACVPPLVPLWAHWAPALC